MKVGIGFDVHDFIANRPLIIGGVTIPYNLGLNGHSDADVLIHSIIDSLVGITIGKDIGSIFPDNDQQYKNIDSKLLLEKSYTLLTEAGYKISNIDSTIIAQLPKLSPYIHEMRTVIAEILHLDIDDITIKATTTEHLGFVGRKEGICSISVALLAKGTI